MRSDLARRLGMRKLPSIHGSFSHTHQVINGVEFIVGEFGTREGANVLQGVHERRPSVGQRVGEWPACECTPQSPKASPIAPGLNQPLRFGIDLLQGSVLDVYWHAISPGSLVARISFVL